MLKITYCTTTDGMGKDINISVSINDFKGTFLFSNYINDINLVNNVLEYLDITKVQLISIKIV